MVAAASKDEGISQLNRRELSHRALEVASILFGNKGAEKYCDVVHSVLVTATNAPIDDGLIRVVLRYVRAGEAE
jgi:hypothetical protein